MILPGFAGEASLYKATESYDMTGTLKILASGAEVLAQGEGGQCGPV
jgi:hypothetical protein